MPAVRNNANFRGYGVSFSKLTPSLKRTFLKSLSPRRYLRQNYSAKPTREKYNARRYIRPFQY